MANGTPDPIATWGCLVCPCCKANFLIRKADAATSRPCPRCGFRIGPPASANAAEADLYLDAILEEEHADGAGDGPVEDVYLEPLEEDQEETSPPPAVSIGPTSPETVLHEGPPPVPTTVIVADVSYLAAIEQASPVPSAPPAAAGDGGYPAPFPPAAAEEPPVLALPVNGGVPSLDEPVLAEVVMAAPQAPLRTDTPPGTPRPETVIPDRLIGSEDEVKRAPPSWPLVQGVFTFPWHLYTLRIWILLAVGFTVVVGLATANCYIIRVLDRTGLIGQSYLLGAAIAFVKGLAFFTLWVVPYAASDFLAIIQETGLGNDEVKWPDDSFMERLGKLLYLLWIALCAAFPMAFVLLPLQGLLKEGSLLAWGLLLLPFVLVFPVFLLCALANNSPWLFCWHTRVMLFLGRRLHVWALMWLISAALFYSSLGLGYYAIGRLEYGLAPVVGLVWSTAVLIYARMLGRMGWVAISSQMTRGNQKRKKRKKAAATERK